MKALNFLPKVITVIQIFLKTIFRDINSYVGTRVSGDRRVEVYTDPVPKTHFEGHFQNVI